MDKLSQSIITLDVHFADKEDRLRNAWDIVHANLVDGQKTNHQQLKHPIDLLCELSRVLELYAPNDVLHSQVDEFINSVR